MRGILRLIVAVFFALPCAAASGQEQEGAIAKAIDAYQLALDEPERNQRVQLFRRAETLFSQAVKQQAAESAELKVSADLYVNLGNAALGAERLGPAVLAYRKGLIADSSHRRALQNLQHARTLLPDWVPIPEEDSAAFGSLFDWFGMLRPSDRFGLAAFAFLTAMVLAALCIRTGNILLRNIAFVFGAFWLASLVWALLARDNIGERVAVIVIPEVTARAADSINAPARFSEPLPSGTELSITERRNDWVHVQLYDSREAWLPASSVETVASK